jgi:hypothetical protein
MRTEYSMLDCLTPATFIRQIRIGFACVDEGNREMVA